MTASAHLVDPGKQILPETMAVRLIQDEDVIGALFWKEVASSVSTHDR